MSEKFEKKELTLSEYQKRAMTTCMPSSNNFGYMLLNLVGEVGEFSSKAAKAIRKGKCLIRDNKFVLDMSSFESKEEYESFVVELQKELGDCLWQLSGLCSVMGWELSDVAEDNLHKLASRKQRGVIDGNGDNR